jgi:hypothetical protein
MNKEELLNVVEVGYRPLRERVASLGEDGVERQTPAGWTVKEMVAHVAFWEETVVEEVRMWRGEPAGDWYGGDGPAPSDPWPETAVHNAREAAWARERSAEQVLARWDRVHERVVALIESFSETEAADERYQEKIKAETYGHYPEHLAEVEALR